ncbi:MAG TPA: hypothetical protein ENG68_01590 [bacterium]|nr:hypothetical protein [bacterium]
MGRRIVKLSFIVSIVIGVCILFAQNERGLEELYREALMNYYRKNYAKAIEIFKKIQGINPSFRTTQIRRYLRSSESKLGKVTPKEKFKVVEEPTRIVKITKENELEVLCREAEKVILDTLSIYEKAKNKLSEFELLTPYSTLKMANEAFESAKYTEAIRLANKARFQIEELLSKKKKPKPYLGKIGKIPVTLNLTDANLQQTLKLIYELTGANIVLSKGVSGRVTINVKNLPLQKVLDLICEANHLKYVEEDNVIKIMTEEEYNKIISSRKKTVKKVFPIRYSDASTIVKALKEIFRIEGIVYEPRTNSVLVNVDDPNLSKQIENTIAILDTPVSEVLLEAKLVDFSTSEENLLGVDWMISSRLIRPLGTSATLTGPRFGETLSFTPGVTSSLPGGFSFGITNSDVNMLITALATRGKAKLIQAPKIMCLNGTTATISVSQNCPYLIPEYEETFNPITGERTGVRHSVRIYEEQVGTSFTITPIIQRNRTVFLNLYISDTRLVEIRRLSAVAAGLHYETEQPIISSRETSQTVTLFDGQTLVCGGMIQSRREVKETGIPFLRKLPLVGYLFKKPTYKFTKSELILFLTPHVVSTFHEAEKLSRPEREKLEKPIKPHSLLKGF